MTLANHTLTVPGDESRLRTVNFVIYISDVTDGVGALHYVAKDDAAVVVLGDSAVAATEQQPALLARQRLQLPLQDQFWPTA